MKTAKWFILDTSDPQILEIEVHGVGKKLARISKGEWRKVIYTKIGQRVQMRKSAGCMLEWIEWDVTVFLLWLKSQSIKVKKKSYIS